MKGYEKELWWYQSVVSDGKVFFACLAGPGWKFLTKRGGPGRARFHNIKKYETSFFSEGHFDKTLAFICKNWTEVVVLRFSAGKNVFFD